MTLTQLEYLVALDTYRHFATAAEHCHVTQPTLSMQIQKLEDELGILVFDRSKQPVVPTETGQVILAQAREVVQAARRIPELVKESKSEISGELRLGIIPTLAPYLLPYFIRSFMSKYPAVTVHVQELLTEQIVDKLKNGLFDVGIVVTPLPDSGLREFPLFYEPFMVYTSPEHPLYRSDRVTADDLMADGLWLLSEGHCFRNQVMNLCGQPLRGAQPLRYETGSLETLMKIIDKQDGFTLIPYLATLDMAADRLARVKPFADPQPVREVSLVTHRSYLKKGLIDALQREILAHMPAELTRREKGAVVAL
ncbi:hydrogen peroxide-inducible genes activator [Nibrella saemangeumensis]|uniref:Hydrogen peroxide-inducible genes activator n=1 Tax=Nibrella saemangeumensis TaxID=1084526 RepID=A0ABP8MP72_9BACT